MRKERERPSPLAIIWTLFKIVFILFLCFVGTAAVLTFRNFTVVVPDEHIIENYTPSEPTRIISYDGVLLAVIRAPENRQFVPIAEIPQNLKNATIAIEDNNFYSHSGMSFRGTIRALMDDLTKRSLTQGGSTITQQLARNLENPSGHSFTGRQKSLNRKITEAILAMELERHYAKDEILQLYLNQVFYGSQSYGVQAAAETYFGKKVTDLDLSDCALLAGLPQRPTEYDPTKNPDLAIKRRNQVLIRMLQLGYITPDQEENAIAKTYKPFHRIKPDVPKWKAPHFVDYVLRQLIHRYGDDLVHRGGLTVYTSLNYRMQEAAQAAMDKEQREVQGLNVHQMALVAIDQHTGYIKAMVGGVGGYEKNQFNRAIHPRQPGSSFKLFDYTAAFEQGLTPDDGEDDAPRTYLSGGHRWTPLNDDFSSHGWMTYRQALAQSVNTVAVKVANRIGVRKIIAVAEKMGVHSDPFCDNRPIQPFLPIAIGACAIAPLEMCVAYATTADHGVFHAPTSILRVKDHNGVSLFDAGRPTGEQVVPKHVADEMNDMLRSVVTSGTGKEANIFPDVRGKTGTTQDDRDAWFIGFTPELTTAVWAGNDNYWSHMEGVHGGSVCAGGWNKFMVTAVPLMQEFHKSQNADEQAEVIAQNQNQRQAAFQENTRMVKVKLCSESLLLATSNCPHTVTRSFPEGKQPTQNCGLDHSSEKTEVYICPVSGKLATAYCPNPILKSFPADTAPVTNCTIHKPTE